MKQGAGQRAGRTVVVVAALALALAIATAPACHSASSRRGPEGVQEGEDPENLVKPIGDLDLQKRAGALFNAIAHDDPAQGEPFWFPRDPFLVLKEGSDPGRYWDFLHDAYANDIHTMHAQRPSWDGAAYVRFEIGGTPTWVPPGGEHNLIGYYRTYEGTIHFKVGDEEDTLPVAVIITWQGRWYVTHLRKMVKKK